MSHLQSHEELSRFQGVKIIIHVITTHLILYYYSSTLNNLIFTINLLAL